MVPIDIIGILFTFVSFAVFFYGLGSSMLKRSRETNHHSTRHHSERSRDDIDFKHEKRIYKTCKETYGREKRGIRITAGLNLKYLFIFPVGSMIVRFRK